MACPDLAHVRWLGGATGAGKSSIARALADTYGFELYSSDASIAAHAADPGPDTPLLSAFLRMGMDERWLRDARTMMDTFPWFAGERFDRIIGDLRRAAKSPLRLAEGFRLLPRLVHPWLDKPWQAVFLVPTGAFRRATFAARPVDRQFWRNTSSPAEAFEKLLERDALFADTVRAQAHELGLPVVTVDGQRSLSELTAEVAQLLRLPTPPRR